MPPAAIVAGEASLTCSRPSDSVRWQALQRAVACSPSCLPVWQPRQLAIIGRSARVTVACIDALAWQSSQPIPRAPCSRWLNFKFGCDSATRGGWETAFTGIQPLPAPSTWQASHRVGGAGLRPAEPVAGGCGDPLRVPESCVGCARSILWQPRQAASPGIRLSPATVDVAAASWHPAQVAPRRAWAAWSNLIGIVSAG